MRNLLSYIFLIIGVVLVLFGAFYKTNACEKEEQFTVELSSSTLTGEVVMFVRESPTFEKSAVFTCPSIYKFIEIQDKSNKVLLRINLEGDAPVCETL